jgi:hypothetical protein
MKYSYIRIYENGSRRYLRNVGNHVPEMCHNPEDINYLNSRISHVTPSHKTQRLHHPTRWLMLQHSDLYLGEARFESRSGHRLSWREDYCFLDCNAVQFGGSQTFRMNIAPACYSSSTEDRHDIFLRNMGLSLLHGVKTKRTVLSIFTAVQISNTVYPDKVLRCFSQSLLTNFWIAPCSRPWSRTSTTFSVYHLLIIRRCILSYWKRL